jgi:amino acid transporter
MLPFATCGLLEKIVTCPRTLSYLPLLRVSETVTIAMNPNPIAAGQPTAGPIASVEPNHETELAAEEIVEQLHSAEVPPEPRPFMHMVLGRPLETAAAPHQTIGKTIGLAVFASDALSSVAYATQEILLVLAAAGAIYFSFALPIAGAIAALLVVLTLSYRQTIFAYPGGGGAYIVARDNLGEGPAQTAGAALLTDYVLTVSVSIASGVEQIISAFPALRLYQVEICVGMILVMTLVNLRGVKESGRAFAGPTYFFIGMALLTLGIGFYRLFSGTLGQVQGVETIGASVGPLTLFLILRAFSSGCTALTGVEAISNGITAFKEPKSRNAATTMAWMSGILMTMFLGITYLALKIHAMPSEQETVISQLGRTVFGRGPFYLLTIAATTAILIMAANTSFADFPRLCALHAGDGFLPRQLTYRGHRLVFSWGIITLAGLAMLLVVAFNGSTSLLIPLYAIGVFLSFTMSQAGMVVRWRRVSQLKPGEEIQTKGSTLRHDPHWRIKQVINAVGCVLTAIVMAVFAVTKFSQGAWIVVILIPLLVLGFFRVHHHYQKVKNTLSLQARPVTVRTYPLETIVLVNDVHQGTFQMISFAESLGKPWVAVHVAVRPEKTARVLEKWNRYLGDRGHLYVLPSPYRSLTGPIVRLVKEVKREHPDAFVNIIMAQLVTDSLLGQLLHRNSGPLFKFAFQQMQGVAVTDVHYRVSEPTDPADASAR